MDAREFFARAVGWGWNAVRQVNDHICILLFKILVAYVAV
jgi:hypothetical protein